MSEKPLENEEKETLSTDEKETVENEADTMSGAFGDETSSEPQLDTENTVDAEETSSVDEFLNPEEVEKRLAELEEELKESSNRYLRLQADYDNFRRRTREEKSQDRKYRAQDLILDILPVLDNFKRALDVETASDEMTSLKQGMEMVYRQMDDALKKEGVEELEALNQPFDPNLHQAVMQEPVEGVEPNTVVEVFQAGYTLNGRIIRPAMVKVSS